MEYVYPLVMEKARERALVIHDNLIQNCNPLHDSRLQEISDFIGERLLGKVITVHDNTPPAWASDPTVLIDENTPERPIQRYMAVSEFTADAVHRQAYRQIPGKQPRFGKKPLYVPSVSWNDAPFYKFKGKVIADDPLRNSIVMRETGPFQSTDRYWVRLVDDEEKPLVSLYDARGETLVYFPENK